MDNIDLFAMRERFNSQQIMLCFNGPISRSLIEEIGNALRNYLAADHAHPSAAMDVFAVYIEMTQNISHYTRSKGWNEQEAGATVVVSRNEDNRYVVSAGNLIESGDGKTSRVGAASGLYFSVGEVGGVLGPMSMGALAHATGDFDASLFMMFGVACILMLILMRLRTVQERH